MQDTYDHLCLIGEGTKAQGTKVIFPVISVARSSIKRNFPGGPVVKNLSCKKKKNLSCSIDVGDVGSIPGWGTKSPHAVGRWSLHATTREATEDSCAATKTHCSQKKNFFKKQN